jgi:chromosome partitioning protein
MDFVVVRDDQPVLVAGIARCTIECDLKRIACKDFVVIDGAPQAHDLAVLATKAANLILISVPPSPYDILATDDLVDLVKQRIELTDALLKAAFVVSSAINGTKIGSEIMATLSCYCLPIIKKRPNAGPT